jgi:hypothetical protein
MHANVRVVLSSLVVGVALACGSSEPVDGGTGGGNPGTGGGNAGTGGGNPGTGGGNPGTGGGSPDAGPPTCARTYDQFNASPKVNTQSTSSWTCTSTRRLMTGNGIPDHAVTTGAFATPVAVQNLSVSLPLQPAVSATVTPRVRQLTGYALNSVKFDPDTAATCTSAATSTMNGSGCVMVMGQDPWRVEAIGGSFLFGTDESNAHTQPNGQYHYHGMPEGMIATGSQAVTLVGYALDGFPVYARYGYSVATDSASATRVIKASYQLKATPDVGRPSVAIFKLGTFSSDYEYVAGSGDLDECNGRTGVTPEFPEGTYHYYITDTFPFIQRCLKGAP